MPVGGDMDARMKSHWRRRLGQLNRRSPLEKATSPLKIIIGFNDLGRTTRQLEILSRALEEAKAIAEDGGLDESQKRWARGWRPWSRCHGTLDIGAA
jgi:hypothetical protein